MPLSYRPFSACLQLVGLIATLASASCSLYPTGNARSPEAIFDAVWSDFDRHYAFFQLGNIDWDALRAIYRDSVATAPSDAEVARRLGGLIGRLNDHHADLTTPFGTFGAPSSPFEHHFAPDVVRSNYFAEPLRATPSNRIQHTRLRPDVGYIYIGSFAGTGWGGEIERALEALKPVDAIVLDIRDNIGGNEDNAREVAARLYDRTRTYRLARFRNGSAHDSFAPPQSVSLSPAGAIRFDGPVALITNRYNASAAEDFVLMLRILPQVLVVGDTTMGVGSNPRTGKLPNGWTYRVPQSVQSTPDGFVYQWRGLPPGLPVPWDSAETTQGRDPYLDAALGRLTPR